MQDINLFIITILIKYYITLVMLHINLVLIIILIKYNIRLYFINIPLKNFYIIKLKYLYNTFKL